MLTRTHAPPPSIADVAPWASATALSGAVANLLLVLFFVLARPFDDVANAFSWLGPANDIAVVVQFATAIPVALAVRRLLPPTRPVRVATAAAVVAMAAVVALQLMLITAVLDFDRQVLLVSAAFLVVYGWVLAVSSTAHRMGSLPRPVTRLGLLVGASYPLGVVIAAPGLLFPWGSVAQFVFAAPGIVIGSIGWLALPVWPWLLARLVFDKSASHAGKPQEERTS
ncbi:hypothetical protein [Micromonospora sp. SL4-19]|uniref:hypothetical protein n=1 Tax=Micromonospora sp. SL4-19 TaxID=3399129 RepID=UPI003A4D844C